MAFDRWPPYVPVAERKRKALRAAAKHAKKGTVLSPVVIAGRGIATTFWGKAWCDNLERYSDFANRLPRGRTYARNGSVIDLRIEAGAIHALVSGSSLYKVDLRVTPVTKAKWAAIREPMVPAPRTATFLIARTGSWGIAFSQDTRTGPICRYHEG